MTPLLGVVLLLASCGDGGGSGETSSGVGAVAYVLTSCRQTGTTMTMQQELRIIRDEAEELTLVSVGPLGPFPSQACGVYGYNRFVFHPAFGPVQRLDITPDGSGVAFELSDEFVSGGRGLLPPEQRGMYFVRADGSGLRRLGPPSRSPGFFYAPTGESWVEPFIGFDPSGQEFAYVDRGPDETDQAATQVFVRGVTPGEARQVTRMPALDFGKHFPEIGGPVFIDARTIEFWRWIRPLTDLTFVTVDRDGKTPPREVVRQDLGGGHFVPIFSIVGGGWYAGLLRLPDGRGDYISEVFVNHNTTVVQLTNFGRKDTGGAGGPFYSARDQRVYFPASVDPFGTNPTENCQIFSIDPLGSDLRQLTFFRESAVHAANGCFSGARPNGCAIHFYRSSFGASQNPNTGTIFFQSNCDPLGQNPNGRQIFAMQPDGSHLRQLTHATGLVIREDEAIDVESASTPVNAPY